MWPLRRQQQRRRRPRATPQPRPEIAWQMFVHVSVRSCTLVVRQASFAAISEKAMKLIYTGGCPRDFTGCPMGWTESAGACTPPADYAGPCTATAITDKEEFAWKCKASWPCASCARDYSACPEGWTMVDGLCTAPSDYSGVCSAAMDFSGFSTKKKAEIAAMCGYAFPCERKGASFLQKKKALSNKDLGAAIGSAIKVVNVFKSMPLCVFRYACFLCSPKICCMFCSYS